MSLEELNALSPERRKVYGDFQFGQRMQGGLYGPEYVRMMREIQAKRPEWQTPEMLEALDSMEKHALTDEQLEETHKRMFGR